MTFEEAARDPRRPLSLTPREWMYSIEAKLAEEDELTEKAAQRIAARKKEGSEEQEMPPDSGTGFEKIDMGIDQLVSGCKLMRAGLRETKLVDLSPALRKVAKDIEDLLDTAIEPYLVDIIEASNKIDEQNEG